jgi:TNF receptor-associated factor 4
MYLLRNRKYSIVTARKGREESIFFIPLLLGFSMGGYDCQFIETPPEYLQTHCPICLLVLREPFQVTCCGKSFCRECIQHIKSVNSKCCPTCKTEGFDSFQNKGLQQPLYGFKVLCCNKEKGCDWQGELVQLQRHLDSGPDRVSSVPLCAYAEATICGDCEECPNYCGKIVEKKNMQDHVARLCPLTYLPCEHDQAGCNAVVHRKDMAAHMESYAGKHLSLLGEQRQNLLQRIKDQDNYHKEQMREQRDFQRKEFSDFLNYLTRVPPIEFNYEVKERGRAWMSDYFYSHIGGYSLRLSISYNSTTSKVMIKFIMNQKKGSYPPPHMITVKYINPQQQAMSRTKRHRIEGPSTPYDLVCRSRTLVIHIMKIKLVEDEGETSS